MAEGNPETVKREHEVLAFWKDGRLFEKSLEKPAPQGEFIFYDGPPFATGLPHTGSLLSSIVKDVVPRYKTMRGWRVPRVWGWDCHGLPIESLVEKELGLKTKKDILTVGVAAFNEKARSMVLKYVGEWEKYVERVGRWVDFKNSYKTMDNSYIESVWWGLKELHKKNLLYEGRKVLMYCTHCETPLAKAEIAMDNTYKDVTEEAVTVKFKVKNPKKHNLPEHTYFLAWTTTPWTLPGNVALAVGPEITYGVIERGGSHYIEAEDGGDLLGKNLVGIEYEPLFEVPALASKRSYRICAAEFVTTGEGTGIVHTAVMYGEDDYALGVREKLPQVQLLEPNGHYNSLVPEFLRGEFYKKAEKAIKEDLERRGLLYARAAHTHSYPHCYRCGSPLIYNAVASWFINIQKVKAKMLSENEKITWVPEHLKHGRFHNIVEQAPDWTISRNRFWASPLPIWKEKGGSDLMVVGSVDELLALTRRSGNKYFVMRHGEARSNIEHFTDCEGRPDNRLTELGRAQAAEAARALRGQRIELIVTSPLPRARETAAVVQKALSLPDSAVMVDERIRETNFGAFNGKMLDEYRKFFAGFNERLHQAPSGGENYVALRRRVGEFLFDLERRYTGKNILVVMHGGPAYVLNAVASRATLAEMMNRQDDETFLQNGEAREILFTHFPHNADYELDLHRPYIDEMQLIKNGRAYERIPEVIDCWVESGSMPFASMGYPRDKSRVNPRRFFGLLPKGYPGDFIAEYIAQTRTWFYYMHAMGLLLFNRRAFASVVTTGTILAADGSKMSKSKGNYTDPYELMERWGADALRLTLMGSVIMQAEDLNFRDEEVREAHNRIIGILWNSYKFFELYRAEFAGAPAAPGAHVLDRWVRARVGSAVAEVTAAMDAYDLPRATRILRGVIEDYSTWYLRRSRERVKGEGPDKQHALATQREALIIISQVLAPIAPFIAEGIYQGLGAGESVHLSEWPAAGPVDHALLRDMQRVREFASLALQKREQAGIKVRQPLASLTIPGALSAELAEVLKEELNVKEIKNGSALELDTNLTPELKEEGLVRGLARRIQDWRKEQKMQISDRPAYALKVTEEEKGVAEKYKAQLIEQTGLGNLTIEDA